MEVAPVNKMQNADSTKDSVVAVEYFYPDYGVTVTATSQADADAKLQAILNTKK